MLALSIKAKKAAKPERTTEATSTREELPADLQRPATDSAREAEIDNIARDLLRDVFEPDRPAVQALALRTARAIRRTMELDRALDELPGSRRGWDVFERVVRLREAEDRVVQRGLLALDLLQQRQVEVRARVDGRRGRRVVPTDPGPGRPHSHVH